MKVTDLARWLLAPTLVLPSIVGASPGPGAAVSGPATAPAAGPRIVVLLEPGFPTIDIDPIEHAAMQEALAGLDVAFMTVDQLSASLDRGRFDLLVLPYGSAFPKAAWPAIRAFLESGGHWVNLGGTPVSVPVTRAASGWRPESRQTAYHRALSMTHTSMVDWAGVSRAAQTPAWLPDPASLSDLHVERVVELNVRFSSTRDEPGEDGTTGQREARIDGLVVGLDRDDVPVAAPIVSIDQLIGAFAGGRWVLANIHGAIGPRLIRAMLAHCSAGPTSFDVRPALAGFRPGERPSLRLRLYRPAGDLEPGRPIECRVSVTDAVGRPVSSEAVRLVGHGELATGQVEVTATPVHQAGPMLFHVTAEVTLPARGIAFRGTRLRSTTGYLVYEMGDLAGGTPVTVSGQQLLRAHEPFAVAGTTYMSSDAHRKFLLDPDPDRWDQDVAAMRRAGVNLIRTGVWTGWKHYMPEVGTLNEQALRALDVFLLTARRHGMPVIFTLFSFLPESWGGENPYLDPRSVQAQRALAGALARRYAGACDLVWDLINEPSFSAATQLWSTRPNYDRFEQAAWRAWLRQRFPSDTDSGHESEVRHAWGMTADEPLALPPLDEFRDQNLFGPLHPLRARDYKLFAQEAFGGWVRSMTAAIRSAGGTPQLVTVGQDEGGVIERPGPLFHGADVDLTSIHTWWFNDALLWDAVMTRRPDRPHLVEETGLMMYEQVRGQPWRTDREARDLLERKMALAFASGASGFVQWIWNTNPYMPSDNEAGIGLFRADGTAKAEFASFRSFAALVNAHGARLAGREMEPVVIVIPHAAMLSVRDVAGEATRRSVRTLGYDLGVPFRAVSEYALPALLGTPKLIVLPSPRILTEAAWRALVAQVERGSTLLVTGPFELDDYWRPTDRASSLGLSYTARPVAPEERLLIDGVPSRVAFRGNRLERVETADLPVPAALTRLHLGEGAIIWSPLPIELAESPEATTAVYRVAVREAGVGRPVEVEPADPAVFVGVSAFTDARLVAVVNESSGRQRVKLTFRDGGAPLGIAVDGGRAVLLVVDRAGRILGSTAR